MQIADFNTVEWMFAFLIIYLFIYFLSLCDLFENKSDLFANESHRKS